MVTVLDNTKFMFERKGKQNKNTNEGLKWTIPWLSWVIQETHMGEAGLLRRVTLWTQGENL